MVIVKAGFIVSFSGHNSVVSSMIARSKLLFTCFSHGKDEETKGKWLTDFVE